MIKKFLQLDQLTGTDELYHYTSCHALQSILQSGSLYATKSSFLNDTNEMAYILEVASKVIDRVPVESWRLLLRQQIVDTMEEFKRHDIFVLSFSEDPDSITLWAEFGNRTGYNLAMECDRLVEAIEAHRTIYCHGRVIYTGARQESIIYELLTKRIPLKIGLPFSLIMEREVKTPGTGAFADLCRRFQKIVNVYAMFFKQPEFAPEKEYRFVFRNPEKKDVRFREGDGFLLPYIEIDAKSDGKMPLDGITVAPKNHVDLARRGMLQYAASLGYELPVTLSGIKLRY